MDKKKYFRALPLAGLAIAGLVAARAMRRRSSYSFAGKCVVITGGSRGLGLILAREFVHEGARVAILARDPLELEHAERDLRARGGQVTWIRCDVSDQQQVQDAIDQAAQQFGRIDVLVNNAGIVQVGPIEHMTIRDFEDAMAVHFWGPLYAMLAALPYMRHQSGGRIVNISSIGGKVAVPHLVPYSASKFALVGLSDGMRAELAREGIRVTTVLPGLMRTGSPVNALFKGQHEDEYTWFAISDSLPGTSIDARRAAHQIVEACRRGDRELVISIQAKMAIMLNNLFPDLTARLASMANRALPKPAGKNGDKEQTGWQSQSRLAPSLLTRLSDRATVENNNLRGHEPLVP